MTATTTTAATTIAAPAPAGAIVASPVPVAPAAPIGPRWVIRPTYDGQPGRPAHAAYCVENREWLAVAAFGTWAECWRAARRLNGA